mmetsp:Transcript_6142/g.7950  ORF Transcript_6142/g.7950 Transcript_6142/m.7950 type:complete len:103 (+) Transcript_6142:704-1012(+)
MVPTRKLLLKRFPILPILLQTPQEFRHCHLLLPKYEHLFNPKCGPTGTTAPLLLVVLVIFVKHPNLHGFTAQSEVDVGNAPRVEVDHFYSFTTFNIIGYFVK